MGSFIGHVIPGSFFLGFAIHWTIQIWIRFFKAKRNQGKYYNSCTYPCYCCCRRLKTYQMEGVLKIVFPAIGVIVEISAGFVDGKFVAMGNGQHSTMYSAFIICGILDILVHHKVRFVPKNAEYLASALAFAIEGLLFKFHLHGRSSLDIQIHTLLVYIVALNVITILAEMQYPNSVIAGLARAFFVILQGTWFYQVAFILYNPIPGAEPWDGENHEQMMITTIIFGWHMLIILIAMITIGAIVSCFIRRDDGGNYKDDEYDMESLIHRDNNGHTLLKMNADDAEDDSDFENEKPVSLKTLTSCD